MPPLGQHGGVEHGEDAERRHGELAHALAGEAERLAVPAHAQQLCLVGARDACGAEVMHAVVLDVRPAQRDRLAVELGDEQLLDAWRLLAVGGFEAAAERELLGMLRLAVEARLAQLEVRQ